MHRRKELPHSGCNYLYITDLHFSNDDEFRYAHPSVRIESKDLNHPTILGTTYVAVGLSEDRWMADDSVIECVLENGIANMYTSYTRVDYTGTDRYVVSPFF